MPYSYRAYGLNIESNDPISHLSPSSNGARRDLVVRFRPSDGRTFPTNTEGLSHSVVRQTPTTSAVRDGDRIELDIKRPDGIHFSFVVEPTSVDVLLPDGLGTADPISFLIGPVFAMVCRLRRQPCLHASVLAIDDRAFALVGRKGAGKSTTAATLLQLGARLVADDVGVLSDSDGVTTVASAYPSIRMVAATMRFFGHDPTDAPRVLDFGDKHYLPSRVFDAAPPFLDGPVRLERIYLLDEREPASSGSDVVAMSSAEALRHANAHAYVGYVRDAEMSALDFRSFAGLARRGAVSRTVRSDSLTELQAFGRCLLDDFARG